MRKVHTRYPLRHKNSFQLQCTADLYSEPSNLTELKEITQYAQQRAMQILVMGEGSNLLFRSDFGGLVIHPGMKGIEKTDESSTEILVRAGAGGNWDHFVAHCVANNWNGPENLSLIPGSTGSAPVQNIGAYGREVCELIDHVEALDTHTGELALLSVHACEFGYRDSIFKHGEINRYIVTHVVFRLKKSAEFLLDYGNVKEVFATKNVRNLTTLRETIIQIRKEKLPDPGEYGNAGSFFKNPVIGTAQFESLRSKYETIPHYAAGTSRVKIPAAWLIEQCGWKGKREGNVGCWPNQPLVIVSYGETTGEAIYQFSEKIKNSVLEKFNIELEREVQVVG